MILKPGMKLRAATGVEVLVLRAPSQDVELASEGRPMSAAKGTAPAPERTGAEKVLLIGKRYVDETADLEVLCVKAGEGWLTCDGREVAEKEAKPLPASD
jgi:hypothetical protein